MIDVPPRSGLGVPVSWEGLDIGAGVRHYEVQVKEAGGSWTAWLSDVSYSQAIYVGGAGKSYTFQIKATDNVNNESVWVESGSVSVEAVTKYYTFGGQKVAMRQGSEVYYLGGDHLGSTSLTTDSAGGVVSEVRYLPYGEVRWSNGTSVTDFGFTSQRNEASFGLLDYNARYYSPVLGRFVSPDTIVPDPLSSGGFNRYRYTRNNPLRYTDPSGHCIFIGIDTLSCTAVALLVVGGTLALGTSAYYALNPDQAEAAAETIGNLKGGLTDVLTPPDVSANQEGFTLDGSPIDAADYRSETLGSEFNGLFQLPGTTLESPVQDFSPDFPLVETGAIVLTVYRGGKYGTLDAERGVTERHHLLPQAVSPLTKYSGPAIQMEYAHHRALKSVFDNIKQGQ